MANNKWEKRITALETQNKAICKKIDGLKDVVEVIRDNHLVHLRRQIQNLRYEVLKADSELDKRLAVLAVKVGAIICIINMALNFLMNQVF